MDSNNLNEGSLGDLFKSAINLPIQAVKLPYKTYKTFYGKHGSNDQYTGSQIQKIRLKQILPIIYSGATLSPNQQSFMDMVNSFLTEQGHDPVDQHNVDMNCSGCVPYVFTSIHTRHRPGGESEETKKKRYEDLLPIGVYNFRFDSELKPVEYEKDYFKKGFTYKLNVFDVKRDRGVTYIYCRNRFLKEGDYILLKTEIRNPKDDPTIYKAYQNSNIHLLKNDIKLGRVMIKIY